MARVKKKYLLPPRDTQADLDLIANCASAAINSPGTAMLPADFAHGSGTVFPKSTMPSVLPTSRPRSEDDALAAKGKALAEQDPLALLIRNNEPEASRRGFDIGMAVTEGQTLEGPGK